jgi:hypothetical protein
VAINGKSGQNKPRALGEAFLHDPRIIRKQGRKEMNNKSMGAY